MSMKTLLLWGGLLAVHSLAQTPGTGNLLSSELQFRIALDSSPLMASDHHANLGQLVTLDTSTDGTLSGAPYMLAGSFAGAGSDPSSNFGSELGVIGVVRTDFFLLSDTFTSDEPRLSVAGSSLSSFVHCTEIVPGTNDGCFLQAVALDAAKTNGFALSPALEISLSAHPASLPGPALAEESLLVPLHCFSFDFYGTSYDELWVNANGNLSFGAPDSDWLPSVGGLFTGPPRIAPCWSALAPELAGDISVELSPSALTVVWNSVAARGKVGSLSSFSVTLHEDHSISMVWGDLDPASSFDIVGIGGGGSSGSSVDFSPAGSLTGGSMEALFEFARETSCGDTILDLAGGGAVFSPTGAQSYTWTGGGFGPLPDRVFPTHGPSAGAQSVAITGHNFVLGESYSVEFGAGNPATQVTVVDRCTLTCVTPAGSGAVDVIITDSQSQASALPQAFSYE